LQANPQKEGTEPSDTNRDAVRRSSADPSEVLELGAGQGHDTLGLLGAGLDVSALDPAGGPLAGIRDTANVDRLAEGTELECITAFEEGDPPRAPVAGHHAQAMTNPR
jgi:hypothetical protein